MNHGTKLKRLLKGTTIHISKGANERYRHVQSNSKWFSGCLYYFVTNHNECLTIKKCGFEMPTVAKKFSDKSGTGWRTLHYECDLPVGVFKVDLEESNEDEIKVYYNEQQQ